MRLTGLLKLGCGQEGSKKKGRIRDDFEHLRGWQYLMWGRLGSREKFGDGLGCSSSVEPLPSKVPFPLPPKTTTTTKKRSGNEGEMGLKSFVLDVRCTFP